MDQKKIGRFIAELRKEKKLTQQELSEKVGVTDRAIGNWENGRRLPDYSILRTLCKELDVTINELLSGEKLSEEKYQEKLEENIINLTLDNKRIIGKKVKVFFLTICLIGIIIFLGFYIYKNYELDVEYEPRTMKCSFEDNALTYTIVGSSVLHTDYVERVINNEKYMIFHSSINIYNKRRSNWEYGESVAKVANDEDIPYGFQWDFDKEANLNQKVMVYYTNKSLRKMKGLDDDEFLNELQQSFNMCSNRE